MNLHGRSITFSTIRGHFFFWWVSIEANHSYDGYAGGNAQGPEPHKGDLVHSRL